MKFPFAKPEIELFPPADQFTKLICVKSNPTLFHFFQFEVVSIFSVRTICDKDSVAKKRSAI